MNTKLSINDQPLAKRSDPWTSDEAGENFHRSGRAETQRQRVLRALRQYGPCTAAELAKAMQCDRYGPHRRLSELERLDLAERKGFRRCRIVGRKCQIWIAVKIEQTLFSTSEY